MPDTTVRWEIRIPRWHPTPLNVYIRMHWGRRVRVNRIADDLVAAYGRMAGVPVATGKRQVSIKLTLQKGDQDRDPDGVFKQILDSLVTAKLLVNDSDDWVELTHPEFEPGEVRATTIVLEELRGRCPR